MLRFIPLLIAVALVAWPGGASGATWTEGVQYARVTPAQQTAVASGRVEVMEVFSYGCPACNAFQPVMEKLRSALPANAQLVFLPAAFNPAEDWPMFQRAYFAAQALGVASLADAARFYARVAGVDAQQFLATASSFGIDSRLRAADAQIVAMHVDATPTLIVNGKYRVIRDQLRGNEELIELVRYLVAKESGA